MANIYTPYNLKIHSLIGDTIVLTWDVSTIIKKKPGVKYRLYGSNNNGATYVFLKECVRLTEEVARDYSQYAVSSYHPDLGESNKSIPIDLPNPKLYAGQEIIPVAVDPEGRSTAIPIGSSGGVIIEGNLNTTLDADHLADAIGNKRLSQDPSTKAKQDEIINAVNEVKDSINGLITQSASNNTEIKDKLTSIENKIIETSTVLLRAETTITGVTIAGAKVTLPWNVKSFINQITVIKLSGVATKFKVEIHNQSLNVAEQNKVIIADSDHGYNPERLDFIHRVAYINLDGNNEIIVKVIPDSGANNQFFIAINGEKAF